MQWYGSSGSSNKSREWELQVFTLAKVRNTIITYLHANDTINEENETNQNGDPRQGLEGFDEGPQQSSDALAFAEKFHEPHDTEQTEEINGDHVPSRLQKKRDRKTKINYCCLH